MRRPSRINSKREKGPGGAPLDQQKKSLHHIPGEQVTNGDTVGDAGVHVSNLLCRRPKPVCAANGWIMPPHLEQALRNWEIWWKHHTLYLRPETV